MDNWTYHIALYCRIGSCGTDLLMFIQRHTVGWREIESDERCRKIYGGGTSYSN